MSKVKVEIQLDDMGVYLGARIWAEEPAQVEASIIRPPHPAEYMGPWMNLHCGEPFDSGVTLR